MNIPKLVTGGLAAMVALSGAALAQPRQYVVTVRPAGAPSRGFQRVNVSRAVIGSAQVVIWGGAAIDPDCAPHPGSSLSVLQQPGHGQVKVVEEPVFVAFPASNPRSACNAKKVPGRRVYYTADAGFSGHDKVVLEGSSEDGTVRRITVDVDVRNAG